MSPLNQIQYSALALALTLALPASATFSAEPPQTQVDTSPLAPNIRAATSLAPVVKAAAPSVVSVVTTRFISTRNPTGGNLPFPFDESIPGHQNLPQRLPVESAGSGVIVTQNGYILTNTHVVENVDEITVVLPDGETEFKASVVGKDDLTDVAVLKVDASNLPAITIGSPATLEVGDLVLAIGNPFGLGQTVTSGIVSAKGRNGFYLRYENFIQTDAPVNPGNSGGALVDAQGRLVGINTLIMSEAGVSAGVNFAIPADLANFVLGKVVKDGKVRRGYLGVELEAKVTEALAEEFKLPHANGALVTRVRPNGPAGQAGMQAGDFITHFNDAPVKDRRDLQFEVAKAEPSSDSTVTVIRNGKETTLTVNLGELDDQVLLGSSRPARRPPAQVLNGVEMASLTPALRDELGLPEDVSGSIVVTSIDPDSNAFKAGLREGSIILEAQHETISSLRDLRDAARNAERERLLLRVRNPEGSVSYLVVNLD
jgi:serine protease Do